MAPPASATQKPVTAAPAPAPTEPAKPVSAKPATEAKLNATAAPAPAPAAATSTQPKAEGGHKVVDLGDWTRYDLGIGLGLTCKEFNNGVSTLDDHCGEYFELNPKHRLHLDEAGKHRLNVGLFWRKDWVDREIPAADGLKDRSRATDDSLGASVAYMFRVHPKWFAFGLDGKMGLSIYNSEQGEPNQDTGELPYDKPGVIVNAHGGAAGRGAQAYPWDGATGAHLSLELALATLNEGLVVKGGVFADPGVGMHVETLTQGSFDQPVNPSGYTLGVELNPIALYNFFTGNSEKKAKPAVAPRQNPTPPAPKAAAVAPTAAPAAKAEPTVDDHVKALAGYKTMMLQLVEGSPDGKVKGLRQIAQEIRATRTTDATVLGGQEAKDKRVAELATRANAQAAGVQEVYAQALAEKAAIETKINAMPEGEEKKKYQAGVKDLEVEFKVKKDNNASMAELVTEAYDSYLKVKANYERYAGTNPGTPKVEFDVEKPVTEVAPAPAAAQAAPAAAKPAAKPAEKPKAPAAAPAPAPAAKPAEAAPAEKLKKKSPFDIEGE